MEAIDICHNSLWWSLKNVLYIPTKVKIIRCKGNRKLRHLCKKSERQGSQSSKKQQWTRLGKQLTAKFSYEYGHWSLANRITQLSIQWSSRKVKQNFAWKGLFWPEAMATAFLLSNSSRKEVVGEKTPYETWNGARPNISNVIVFGSKALSYI